MARLDHLLDPPRESSYVDYRAAVPVSAAWVKGDLEQALQLLAELAPVLPDDVERRLKRCLTGLSPADPRALVSWQDLVGLSDLTAELAEKSLVSLDAYVLEQTTDSLLVADEEVQSAEGMPAVVRSLRVRFMVGLGHPLTDAQRSIPERLATIDDVDAQTEALRYRGILASKSGDFEQSQVHFEQYAALRDRVWPDTVDNFDQLARFIHDQAMRGSSDHMPVAAVSILTHRHQPDCGGDDDAVGLSVGWDDHQRVRGGERDNWHRFWDIIRPPNDYEVWHVVNRRQFLTGSAAGMAGVAGGLVVGRDLGGSQAEQSAQSQESVSDPARGLTVPFRGERQAGIATASQRYATFAAFDLTKRERPVTAALMESWTNIADQLSVGAAVQGDSGEATGMGPAGLTVTFGFGETLFDDNCAPASAKPGSLLTLPEFTGDQLDPKWGGGDVLIQVCAEDPAVVSHALHQFRRVGQGRARLRWSQAGFLPQAPGETPRNLFGQVDGTANPALDSPELDELVWVTDGPSWMVGGTYLATRRIRMIMTAWDRMSLDVQEATIGRVRHTGAPLSGGDEFTEPDLDAVSDGVSLIAPDSHMRITKTNGPGMLRRGYSFDNGPLVVVETDVPEEMNHDEHGQQDHRPMMAAMDDHDAGLFFAAFVRDPAKQFVPMQEALSASDALGHFLSYTSADLWAIPAGAPSGSIARELFT